MKIKIIILTLFIISACSHQKKASKWIPKLKEWGYLQDDTVIIPGDSIKGETIIERDSVEIEKIVSQIKDTCISKTEIRRIIKNIPCKVKPISVDSARFKLDIWSDSTGKLKYSLRIKENRQIKQNAHVCPNPFNWWKVIAVVLFVALIGLIFKK